MTYIVLHTPEVNPDNNLWTVGYYDEAGEWMPIEDHDTPEAAQADADARNV